MRRIAALLIPILSLACGDGPRPIAQTAPTPTPTTPTPPAVVTTSGTVTAINGGHAIAGARVEAMGQQTTTNASGQFTLSVTPSTSTYRVTISGANIVTLQATASTDSTPALQVIARLPDFDETFYQRFVFDGGAYQLSRQTQAPLIYLRTVDNAGAPIPSATLDTTASAIINGVGLLTGGRFGVAGLERGTGTRRGSAGWITVEWSPSTETGSCGSAQVGADAILLNYRNRNCGCGASLIRPLTVKHELGHALGFYHTLNISDLMSGLADSRCDLDPSPRERAHAAIAYSRPINTLAPDSWPTSTVIGRATR